ncbi:glycosyltransferase family 4 protein [Flavobacterium branchiophilum]|uniref:Glycosyl transferase, group 1 family protein n=1 Tax=Flavobacterium branchiophilum (strain FL-15) TaxID=1034807 RepID=G2Z7I1_FLABF|nr:glycosyltransferase family 4 protein [Flavobacterium branchiophilum]CCB69090.1 Glycosyl transferase, group 1 family protein [Flavobacterium branchiophilum FL-15]
MVQNTLLIIGSVWIEPQSTAAGSRMLQLIAAFQSQSWQIIFASTAADSAFAIDLDTIGIQKKAILLNDASFDHFIKAMQPQIVLFDRFMTEEQFGWRVAANCPEALRVLDSEDLHFLRKIREEKYKNQQEVVVADYMKSTIAFREIAAIYRCDVTLIISEFEMQLLKNVFKIPDEILFYLPFLIDEISVNQQNKWLKFEERAHFISIGNFRHEPNWHTVLRLKQHIWPEIRKKIPTAQLHIYGAYPTPKAQQLHQEKDGFLIKGRAECAHEVIQKSRVLLAPIPFGAGLKGKLIEAMQNGTPSVTTPIGAEAMHAHLPWNGAICEQDSDFVLQAIDLYQNSKKWYAAQQNGLIIINKLYQKKQFEALFMNQMQVLLANIKNHRTINFIGNMLQHHSLQSTKYLSKWIEEKQKNQP